MDSPEEIADAPTHSGGAEARRLVTYPDPGERLAGYRIQSVVGRGGMGVVYRAEHLHLTRVVALKVLTPELAASETFRRRFVNEARTAAMIDHPNVVPVYDAGEADGLLYIAMKLVEGSDLDDLLAREGRLDPDRALPILDQVAAGLDAAHRHGLVHRDVKPANVLMEEGRCYVSDFGLTKRLSSETALTAEGRTVGTAAYLAPEQIRGDQVDPRADVYALACVVFQCLAGATPFERDTDLAVMWAHIDQEPPRLSGLRPDLPSGVDDVVAKALSKAREERYRSCGDLIRALRAELGAPAQGRPVQSRAPAARVLFVSADRSSLGLARAALRASRVVLDEAGDAETARELARREAPDIAFIDAGLHETECLELARALKDDPATARRTKIVVLAPRGFRIDSEAHSAAVDDYLLKPFAPLQLLAKVRDFTPEALDA